MNNLSSMACNQQNLQLQQPFSGYYLSKTVREPNISISGSSTSGSTSPSDCNSSDGPNSTVTINSQKVPPNSNINNFCFKNEIGGNKSIFHLINQTSNLPITQNNNVKNTNNFSPMTSFGNASNNSIMRRHTRQWTREEDDRLCEATKILGTQSWQAVAMYVGNGRNQSQCSQRWQRVLDPKIKKTTWTESEDQKLLKFVEEYGTQRWMRISNEFGNRSDVQCRYRYYQLLKKKNRKFYPSCNGCNEIETQKISICKEMKTQKYEDLISNNDEKIIKQDLNGIRNHDLNEKKFESLIGSGYNQEFSVLNLMNSNVQLMEEFKNQQFVKNSSLNDKINSKIDGNVTLENKINLPSITIFLQDPNCAIPKKQLFD